MLERLVNWTAKARSSIVDYFNRPGPTAAAGDPSWIAYELRPTSYRRDIRVNIGGRSNLTGYYTEKKENKIVIVRTDKVLEYSYSRVEDFESAISDLTASEVPVINFGRGVLKALMAIAIFLIFLQLVASFGPIG